MENVPPQSAKKSRKPRLRIVQPSEGGKPDGAWEPILGVRRASDGSLEYKTGVADGENWSRLSSPIFVDAMTRDLDSKSWGRLLRVIDPDGRTHKWAMPARLLSSPRGSDYIGELHDMGATITQGNQVANALHRYLSATVGLEGKKLPLARAASRTGWNGKAFVLVDRAIGDDEPVVFQSVSGIRPALKSRGTLADWQQDIALPCVGNHRLVLAVSAAFAAPLLNPLGAEGFGVNFVGPSSLGKTTLLQVAGSAWGGGSRGYLQSWEATANGIEAMAEAHNDVLLCLDELGQVRAEDASRTAYSLTQGIGRQRATRSGMGAQRLEWRTLFLSSGELTLADKLREAKTPQRLMAGQEVRFLNIPADAGRGYGIFDQVPLAQGETAETAGRRLSDKLKSASSAHYGTAGPAFVDAFIADRDHWIAQMRGLIATFTAGIADTAGAQAQRVAARFGVLAAAGELAIALGIVPWTAGNATTAARHCFDAWVSARGGTQNSEATEVVGHLRSVIERDGASRFQRPGSVDAVRDRLGFVRDAEGDTQYLIFPEAWKTIMAGRDPKRAALVLADRGIILRGADRITQKPRVGGMNDQRFYVVSHTALFADEVPHC